MTFVLQNNGKNPYRCSPELFAFVTLSRNRIPSKHVHSMIALAAASFLGFKKKIQEKQKGV
jgi:hypothetical protein